MEVHAHTHTASDPDKPSGQEKMDTLFLGVSHVVQSARGVASVRYSNNGFHTRCKKTGVRWRAVGSVHLMMSRADGTHLTSQLFPPD